jgi:hypothetical protein
MLIKPNKHHSTYNYPGAIRMREGSISFNYSELIEKEQFNDLVGETVK